MTIAVLKVIINREKQQIFQKQEQNLCIYKMYSGLG